MGQGGALMSEDNPIWRKVNVAEAVADTAHLTPDECAAYQRLQWAMWRQNGELPNDPEKLQRLTGISRHRWPQVCGTVGTAFNNVEGGKIESKMVKAELR